jgi:hypothetical protein
MMFDRDDLSHHGAENSPLKNSAPSSLTALKTSESTSILAAYRDWAFVTRMWDDGSSIRDPADRIVELDREQCGPRNKLRRLPV